MSNPGELEEKVDHLNDTQESFRDRDYVIRLLRSLETIDENQLTSSAAEKVTQLQSLLQQLNGPLDGDAVSRRDLAQLICDPELAPLLPEQTCRLE